MSKDKTRVRSRNLTDADIASIVGVLDGWTETLSWEGLIEAISKRLGVRYTRQTLSKHVRIQNGFNLAKTRQSAARNEPGSKGLNLAGLSDVEAKIISERYQRLSAEVDRLRLENEQLLEQFIVWAYNAHTRGLDEAFLSRPIPSVDRGQTKRPPKAG